MDDYAGRVLAGRYRLPLPSSDAYELTETRAFDTYSGQEVMLRQVPLPEVVEAEVLDADGLPDGFTARDGATWRLPAPARDTAVPQRRGPAPRQPADPAVRRAVEAAQAAARIPDHPRLDQVFDVFTEGGSLWIASELVPARPLAALLDEGPLTPYRAAEVASDLLMALRVLHGHGWVHRNITPRTVLVCDDGRVILSGLAVGAAEEALCGYDPVPDDRTGDPVGDPAGHGRPADGPAAGGPLEAGHAPWETGPQPGHPSGPAPVATDPEGVRRSAIQAHQDDALPPAPGRTGPGQQPGPVAGVPPHSSDVRAARADAIAAYREGARAAARAQAARQAGHPAVPEARQPAEDDPRLVPPGRITDPYGVREAAGPRRAAAPAAGREAAPGAAAPRPQGAAGHGTADTVVEGAPAAQYGVPAPRPAPAGDRAGTPARRGPATALDAERARQARMTVVGPVTERWAPEQAGPVHANWQLAAPVGPATDLWALGALLFRAVQGHPPYPEESTAELVQMVCAEPPAFAEECGPLRPVVESLLRQDATERPDVEELAGWLRSLVRSAPEPEAGTHVVAAPPPEATGRLPVVRRRGELVRRRRAQVPAHHGRHKRAGRPAGSPRRLGRVLLLLILLLVAGALAYAMLFMPKAGQDGAAGPVGSAGQASPVPSSSGPDGENDAAAAPGGSGAVRSSHSAQARNTGTELAHGYALREDPAGFQIALPENFERTPGSGPDQVVYAHGDLRLIVVPGRDSAAEYGSDPMVYQREKEGELRPYRESSWATSSGLRTIKVGDTTMAEGQFTWTGSDGRELFVRNAAILLDGRYHVVQVRGPQTQRDEVNSLYEQAQSTYRFTG
ncbi:serine/threonine protein kinase [Streptomyces thermodiastaticus]